MALVQWCSVLVFRILFLSSSDSNAIVYPLKLDSRNIAETNRRTKSLLSDDKGGLGSAQVFVVSPLSLTEFFEWLSDPPYPKPRHRHN